MNYALERNMNAVDSFMSLREPWTGLQNLQWFMEDVTLCGDMEATELELYV
jgi:hypothetical protein